MDDKVQASYTDKFMASDILVIGIHVAHTNSPTHLMNSDICYVL